MDQTAEPEAVNPSAEPPVTATSPAASSVGTSDTPAPGVEASGTSAATSSSAAEGPASGLYGLSFAAESGLIACQVRGTDDDGHYAECAMLDAAWEVEDPEDCGDIPFDGRRAGISDDGEEALVGLCTGDPPVHAAQPVVLPDGYGVSAGNIRCVSRESGVRCEDTASGHGFEVSFEQYSTF